jgi:hypothetical protein
LIPSLVGRNQIMTASSSKGDTGAHCIGGNYRHIADADGQSHVREYLRTCRHIFQYSCTSYNLLQQINALMLCEGKDEVISWLRKKMQL